ncbi:MULTISPECIES: pseudouridine synthase [Thermodesulfovibrio]|jgi:pseudouridine synthase|uniref:pseudouridine synthase n=1 Tax=Thermodesulfovibrio TaxID=28261 RepID=UPI0026166BB0|nr:pseudouridine synthase [Thermodesulfovibrio sp.]
MAERLQKILSDFGITSRRQAEELIKEGRVTVNGNVAILGQKADPERDYIKVDGKLLIKPEPKVYYAFYKPRKVITSLLDPQGRPTVKDFLKGIKFRVYPVGRLDFDSEGLLLLTNDGALAHQIMHPSSQIEKTYMVKVEGLIERETIEKLRKGVKIEGRLAVPVSVNLVRTLKANSWIRITLHEGRKRQIRKMLERVGHPVIRLIRVAIDGVRLGELKPGQLRPLTKEEIEQLKSKTKPRDPTKNK